MWRTAGRGHECRRRPIVDLFTPEPHPARMEKGRPTMPVYGHQVHYNDLLRQLQMLYRQKAKVRKHACGVRPA